MRILIVGAGAVGFYLARRLTDESHEVTVVDSDPRKVLHVSENLDVLAVLGNGASAPVLEEAGLARAEILMAVSGVDEVNLLACLIALGHGVPVKIARASHPEHHGPGSVLAAEVVGVDLFISPEQECAWELFQLLNIPAATDVARLADGRVQMVGVKVRAGAPLSDRSLAALDPELAKRRFVVASVVRNGRTEVPTGSTVIRAGDKVLLLAPVEELGTLAELTGHEPATPRRVMIAGGSGEAVHLARHLLGHGVRCTILDRDRERCRELAELLPGALVLEGDATDYDLLEMEGVDEVDGFVALTDRDEVNMLAALLAKSAGARRVIPLIHKVEYMNIVDRVGMDAAVSPRISAANAILRYVRRGGVAAVATVKGSEAEAIETVIPSGSRLVGQAIRDVRFPPGAVLGVLVRSDRVIMPRGDDWFEAGDHAIFFVLPEAVEAVEKLLA